MKKILLGLAATAALGVSALSIAQSGSVGSGSGVGGTNVDNVSLSVTSNIVTVALTLTDGGTIALSAPAGEPSASPQSIVASLLAQLEQVGGSSSGPLAMAIRDAVEQ